jgi:hypothetical protein
VGAFESVGEKLGLSLKPDEGGAVIVGENVSGVSVTLPTLDGAVVDGSSEVGGEIDGDCTVPVVGDCAVVNGHPAISSARTKIQQFA